MKLRFSTPLIAAVATLLLLASCSSKTNKQGKMIPKEAGFVLHFNGKSLFEKLNIAEIKQTDWYKQMMEEVNKDSTAPVFVKRFHENMASSGIDSVSDMLFFGQKDPEGRTKLVFEGGLRDAKAFESFLKTIYPEGSIVKDGDIQSMAIMSHAVLTWNKDKFAMGMMPPEMGGWPMHPPLSNLHDQNDSAGMAGMPRRYYDDSSAVRSEESNSLADITSYCKNLYSLKESNSLGADEKFSELMNTEGDIHAWVSVDNLMGGTDMPMGMMSMMKLDAFTKDNVSTYTVNFDKGKVVVKLKSYMSKELSDILKKYSGGSINTDMIKNIPSENVMGVLAFHFNPEGLKKMVELSGMEPFINLMTMKQGMTVDDFIKANKGDLLLVVSDLKMKKDSFDIGAVKEKKGKPYVFSKPDMKILFSAAINDKDAFKKLIGVGSDMREGKDDKFHYNSNANYFAISNDSASVEQYLAGGKHEQPFLSKISGNAIGGYADIQKILMATQPDPDKDSLTKQMWDASVKMWDNAVLTGGDYSNGGLSQQFELNLMDKNTNSLRQLFQYAMTMSGLAQKKAKLVAKEYDLHFPPLDSTKVKMPPPPPSKKKKK